MIYTVTFNPSLHYVVPADSRRIPRAPRYSGYYYASTTYEYATVMLYGLSFQKVLLRCLHATT